MAVILALVLIFAPVSDAALTAAPELKRPALTIDDALAIARQHLKNKRFDLSRHYIDSARLDLNPRGDRGKRWIVTFALENANVLGGQIFVQVYMNRSVELKYGE
ncbi:MAG TPA: hypothetical protein V6D23_28340 [Candidatus Obscuribacterales bacterium]